MGSKALWGSQPFCSSEKVSVKAFALPTCENNVTRKMQEMVSMRGLLGVTLVTGLFLERA